MEEISTENISGLSGVSFDSNDTSTDKLTRLYEMYEAGRYNDVIASAEADSLVSTMSYGQLLIGNCYEKLGNKTEALNHWKKSVEISPLEHSAYINIGNYHYSSGNIREAILNWHIACTITPENPTVNLNLAHAYDKKGSRIKATKYFEKFLKYSTRTTSTEYITVKHAMANLTAKVDFYAKKVEEYKLQKDIKTIAALYLKMISTYADLPSIYANLAEIFSFDKNYEKAYEFYQIVYLNFPCSVKILLEMANLAYILGYKSYSYAYYSRAIDSLPEGTSYYSKVKSQLNSLSSVLKEPELIETHLQKAREAAENNDYEIAIDEYENFMILSESENEEIKQAIDKYKIYLNPEPFVINMLYNQIPDLMNRKKLSACVEVCDRIIKIASDHSKEVVYAMKCKAECKRIIIAREQFGV